MTPVWFALAAAPLVGSVLGVLIVRLPAGEGVVFGRSRCRACAHPLAPADLVPLVSWLVRRGRCRYCGAPVSALYPGVELAAIVVVAWAAVAVPAGLVWPSALLGWMLLALALIDLRALVLPDVLTLPLAAAGLAIVWWLNQAAPVDHAVGAALGWLTFRLIAAAYARLRRREGLGRGDAKLAAATGAWVGWQGLPTAVLLGSLAALVAIAVGVAAGRSVDAASRIPFGPFLALGLWLTWLYGPLGLAPSGVAP
jgi:leader peptidase (prepilin peptidase)/N-methyltransferase